MPPFSRQDFPLTSEEDVAPASSRIHRSCMTGETGENERSAFYFLYQRNVGAGVGSEAEEEIKIQRAVQIITKAGREKPHTHAGVKEESLSSDHAPVLPLISIIKSF
ncbi:hypothetical protein PBY51_025069 [Eleginops maclovinus]|uniref:Uncharacterized protein n=1 Tax=Eleginops maclovinus TaxID=56733 RepID=A0AAN7XUR8_ELEMC|nr:hypothetical protein PBY51_025069 [Eleginops maclovinus]